MKDIVWDKVSLADFKALAFLTADEERVLDGWARGWSITRIADHCHMTDRNVCDIKKTLRDKYDRVQIYSPLLPARK